MFTLHAACLQLAGSCGTKFCHWAHDMKVSVIPPLYYFDHLYIYHLTKYRVELVLQNFDVFTRVQGSN
jgi:hypothetical protein